MTHKCPCGCETDVDISRLACRTSWNRAPGDLRRWVYCAYRKFGARSPEHLAAIRAILPYLTGEKPR